MTPRELTAMAILWREATTTARRAAVKVLPELIDLVAAILEQVEAPRGAVLSFPKGDDVEDNPTSR